MEAPDDGYRDCMREGQETPHDDPLNESEGAAEEDITPEDAPAEPASDPTAEGAEEPDEAGEPDDGAADDAGEPDDGALDDARGGDPERAATNITASSATLPRTTTTGDDEQDLRKPGDGAVSGIPGGDLEDSGQRHEDEP
jgi:hypothetical protein